jgi:hypothetical protein
MELLFSPCNRLHDLLENQEYHDDWEEVIEYDPELLHELNLDVSTEEFLSAERA